jgi:hypothetical protein
MGERWGKNESRNGASADGMPWHAVGLLSCKNDPFDVGEWPSRLVVPDRHICQR